MRVDNTLYWKIVESSPLSLFLAMNFKTKGGNPIYDNEYFRWMIEPGVNEETIRNNAVELLVDRTGFYDSEFYDSLGHPLKNCQNFDLVVEYLVKLSK